MTTINKDFIRIPTWLSGIFVASLLGIFATGFQKFDHLQEKMIILETSRGFEREKLSKIECQLEEVLKRLNSLEKKN
jgi:hypothetical protein